MKTITLYGIPNCDSVKRARAWLDSQGLAYTFHDYKKQGVPELKLRQWIAAKGWETVLNRRGTTWRKLDETTRAAMIDADAAIALMQAQPSIIKRPIIELTNPETIIIGHDETALTELANF